jgi:hypothetical protein
MTKRKQVMADHVQAIRDDKATQTAHEYDTYATRATQKIFDFSKVDAELNFYVADRNQWIGYFEGDINHCYKVVVDRRTKHLTVFPIGDLDHL